MTTLRSRDECTCSCHRTGGIHIVACCTGVFNDSVKNAEMEAYYAAVGKQFKLKTADEILEDVDAALENEYRGYADNVHEYRKAIADDCIVGICSVNNCLYPSCSATGKAKLHSRLVDDAINEVKVVHGHSMLFDKGPESV